MLILPGSKLFDETLGMNLPPGHIPGSHFVARADSGILEPVSGKDLTEYLDGGEYEERQANAGFDDEEVIDIWIDL
jgi:hypothetical protein